MRAVRFACVLNFQFEQKTEAAIGQYSYLLEQIARERIQAELDKILTSSWAAYGLQTLARLHCLPYFLPELEQAFIFEQTSGHTVFSHTAKAVALVPDTIVLRLAALLHDIRQAHDLAVTCRRAAVFQVMRASAYKWPKRFWSGCGMTKKQSAR